MVALDTWALPASYVADGGLRNALFCCTSGTQDSTDLAAIYHRLFVMRADWQWPEQRIKAGSSQFQHVSATSSMIPKGRLCY